MLCSCVGTSSCLLILHLHVKLHIFSDSGPERVEDAFSLMIRAITPEVGKLLGVNIEGSCITPLSEKLGQIILLDTLAHIELEVEVVVCP